MPAPAHHAADYAELHALSHFSFRRAASSPAELVERAHALGYRALALTDTCSMAGVVRAHEAAQAVGLPLIVGTELVAECGTPLVLLAESQAGYARICRLITQARRRAKKGSYRFQINDLNEGLDQVTAIWKAPADDLERAAMLLEPLRAAFGDRLWLGATRRLVPGERAAFERLDAFGRRHDLPRLACGDVRMHRRSRRALLDVLTALDCNRPLAECGRALAANGEAHLRPRETLARLYPAAWLEETVRLAERCAFRLDGLNYRYPKELVPEPLTPTQHLRRLTLDGLRRRWPDGPPEAVRAQIAHELRLIEEMGFEAFFLTVHDVVEFARGRGILCQGRGSAANSAVCYCLGITEVDPSTQQLLFERFISKERNEPPDIDVDFEHERREEVLQYIYAKYGRERAALAATVIHYRPKSALKDVGRALGLDPTRMSRLTASLAWWDQPDCWPERLRAAGFDPDSAAVGQLLTLTSELIGMPRHLSQHVGGMVISDAPLHELVPVENAAMADRTIIQWDKDDLETLGLLKVDCLALGMLTALRKGLDLVNGWRRRSGAEDGPLSLAAIPREDPATYTMLAAGDAVGVFQVESRAQMAMLPRLKPRCFYDLVIEVAIVRPGPIQGDMVHPYLERRDDPSRVSYPGPALESVLKRTLGVPIFQEQVMQIAIVAAGFTPGEADQLRRAMAAWKRRGGLEPFRDKLIDGMLARGYSLAFAERIYGQICGFGDYGFPESHAASFALLTYFSSWLKRHHPAAFCCGLLNSQPMGFYAPAQLIADVRRHGVRVLPVDVRASDVDCSLCPDPRGGHEWNDNCSTSNPAIRLGLRLVRGLAGEAAERLVAARAHAPFRDTGELAERAGLDAKAIRALAEAGALKGLAGHRRRARWQALGARRQGDLLAHAQLAEQQPQLGLPGVREDLLDDYAATGLSLDHHPIGQLRRRLGARVKPARALAALPDGSAVQAAGVVTHRQRPGTASGVVFLSLEDETGIINVIVWPKLLERFRAEVLQATLLKVVGTLQNANGTQHVVAHRFETLDGWLDGLAADSRDFC
ncbi:error-prone DNA polymerase [Wenzhouxiangella sp. XN79A]|uniref:error-prone DNA polymerase n=1 Tax=Wenzhouxiangella sp. XN79A TaxID=2724193 RepID=UPI00144A6B06|nr:error-prone DNA polymerase [Wenzhouxiangella sp. XN79A]NKI34419.1 error-prone DNA polymerase [Wenzhouxiangella sp. XN79A]